MVDNTLGAVTKRAYRELLSAQIFIDRIGQDRMSSVLKKDSVGRLIKVPTVLQRKIIEHSTTYNEKAVDNYYNLVQQSDTQGICLICLEASAPADIEKIAKCSHTYCAECLHNYLIYRVSTGADILCPSSVCNEIIPKTSASFKQLPKWTRDRYDKIQLYTQNMGGNDKRLCGSGGCIGTVDYNTKEHKCDTCGTDFCGICQLRKHAGKECEAAFPTYFRQWRRCPGCRQFLQKTEGGNKMKCTSCKDKFCAVCNQPWETWHEQCQKQVDPVLDNVYNKQSILQCCRCWNVFKGVIYVILLPIILLLALVAVVLTFFLCIIIGFLFSPCYARAEGYSTWATLLCCPCIGIYAVGYAIGHFLWESLKIAYSHLRKYCNTIKVLFSYDPSSRALLESTSSPSNAIQF